MTEKGSKSSPIKAKKRAKALKRGSTIPNEVVGKKQKSPELYELPSNKSIGIQDAIKVESPPSPPIGSKKTKGSMPDKENGDPAPEDPEDSEDPEEVDRAAELSETSRSDENEVMVVEQPKTEKKKTRSVSGVVDALQGHCAIVKIWVTDSTLCSNPLLNAAEVNIHVHQAWRHAADKQELCPERPKEDSALLIHCSFHPSHPITDCL